MLQKLPIASAFCAGLFSLAVTTTTNAALLGRLPATPGGTDYQAYYDTTLDITWLADANYAKTSGYNGSGLMTWDQSMTWVSTLNTANYLGFNDWRLPMLLDTGTPGCDFAYSGTDCAYNVQTGSAATTVYSEIASLWYDTLGNTAQYDTSGNFIGCPAGAPEYCLTNTGPFSNIQFGIYWFGVKYAPGSSLVWFFDVNNGLQAPIDDYFSLYAWAVRSGDVSAVPVPAAVWLFVSGLVGLLAVARRRY